MSLNKYIKSKCGYMMDIDSKDTEVSKTQLFKQYLVSTQEPKPC